MDIVVKNLSSGQLITLQDDYIASVEVESASTLKVKLKNKMTYIVEYHDDLLRKAPKQLALFDPVPNRGEKLKIKGIKRAVDHANIKNAGTWADKAYQTVKLYLLPKKPGYSFLIEDVRMWAEEHSLLPEPPNKRAWGGITKKLVKESIMHKVGHANVKNENAHSCFATMWAKS